MLDIGTSYDNITQIGQGAFSTVYRARLRTLNVIVAIKAINRDQMPKEMLDYVFQEIDLLKQNKNQNIIKLYQYKITQSYIYIIMEYLPIDLLTFWEEYFNCNMPEHFTHHIIKQLVSTFAYLHQKKIIHRDLKLDNILVQINDSQLEAIKRGYTEVVLDLTFKLADFGLSKKLTDEYTQTYAGSPMSMAPEIMEMKQYGLQADMYSLGVLFYQLIYGEFPFTGDLGQDQINLIKKQNLNFNKNIQVSQETQELIRRMLQYDPQKRIQWKELYNHKFITTQNQNQLDVQIQKNKTVYNEIIEIEDEIDEIDDFEIIQEINASDETNQLFALRKIYIIGNELSQQLLPFDTFIIEQNNFEILSTKLFQIIFENRSTVNVLFNQMSDQIYKTEEYKYFKVLLEQSDSLLFEQINSEEQVGLLDKLKQSIFGKQQDPLNTLKRIIKEIQETLYNLITRISQQKLKIDVKNQIMMNSLRIANYIDVYFGQDYQNVNQLDQIIEQSEHNQILLQNTLQALLDKINI
ncbi:hypothetical protein pb186bvf_010228 [Paramecium bursaria]